MTMATGVYTAAKKTIGGNTVDLDTDTFHGFLVADAYTPDYTGTGHDFRNDITNEVGTSGSYTNGTGFTLGSVTWAISGNEVRWDFADPVATSATITARGLVNTKWRGGASSADELVCGLLFTGGADVISTAGTFTVVIDATGAMALA
jgi:hypothetical protein